MCSVCSLLFYSFILEPRFKVGFFSVGFFFLGMNYLRFGCCGFRFFLCLDFHFHVLCSLLKAQIPSNSKSFFLSILYIFIAFFGRENVTHPYTSHYSVHIGKCFPHPFVSVCVLCEFVLVIFYLNNL